MGDSYSAAPRLALTIGVTGHRHLPDPAGTAQQLVAVLAMIEGAVAGVAAECGAWFADVRPEITILSQLAIGADQIAAGLALERGHAIGAILPFPLDRFRGDFEAGDRARFDALLGRCRTIVSLPEEECGGYALAGEATVAQSDVVIAVWDGHPARGWGGTGDVVAHAIRRGVPVLHLSTGREPARILWASIAGVGPALLDPESVPARPLDETTVADVIGSILRPPIGVEEERAYRLFLRERPGRAQPRPEYPLLLALFGVRSLGRDSLAAVPLDAPADRADPLAAAFQWSDRLAAHYAQVYRSGAIFNFAAAAAAVLLALSGVLMPHHKVPLLAGELVVIGALVVNTSVGNRRDWHRRWLDYRYLAEQLRPMACLKRLAAAQPPSADRLSGREGARWTDWLAMAIWRDAAPQSALADADAVFCLARTIADAEIAPQLGYHRANARRMHLLEHRLHRAGTLLFLTTVAVGVAALAGFVTLGFQRMHPFGPAVSVLAAALPALGSAVFGIRGQGDFAGTARRSLATAIQLERRMRLLREQPLPLRLVARLSEEAAAAMAADLNEWRLSYRDRKLVIPS